MANLTDAEASAFVRQILARLSDLSATDVIAGIDESRRLGIEEPIGETSLEVFTGALSERKQLGTVRRRPPTELEMLQLVLERLQQRLVVVPSIGRALQDHFQGRQIIWRVDREFVSVDRLGELEADLHDLVPDGVDSIESQFRKLTEMIREPERIE